MNNRIITTNNISTNLIECWNGENIQPINIFAEISSPNISSNINSIIPSSLIGQIYLNERFKKNIKLSGAPDGLTIDTKEISDGSISGVITRYNSRKSRGNI